MLETSNLLIVRFERVVFKKEILRPYRNQSLKWLRYSLDFGSKCEFVESDARSLPDPIRNFEENNQTAL